MNFQDLSAPALCKRRRRLVRDLPPIQHVLRGTLVETYNAAVAKTATASTDQDTVRSDICPSASQAGGREETT